MAVELALQCIQEQGWRGLASPTTGYDTQRLGHNRMSQAWVWAAARVAGTSHLKQGLPCQDSFACRVWQSRDGPPVLVAALADGAGSAERADVGSALATSLLSTSSVRHSTMALLSSCGLRPSAMRLENPSPRCGAPCRIAARCAPESRAMSPCPACFLPSLRRRAAGPQA